MLIINKNNLSINDINRFNSKYIIKDNDDCWEWQAHCNKDGYGQIKINGEAHLAHRVSYVIDYGAIMSNYCILHNCDNPRCIRGSHLRMGTRKENNKDMCNKGGIEMARQKGKMKGGNKHIEYNISYLKDWPMAVLQHIDFACRRQNKQSLVKIYELDDGSVCAIPNPYFKSTQSVIYSEDYYVGKKSK